MGRERRRRVGRERVWGGSRQGKEEQNKEEEKEEAEEEAEGKW